jgi:hypothetical protein
MEIVFSTQDNSLPVLLEEAIVDTYRVAAINTLS